MVKPSLIGAIVLVRSTGKRLLIRSVNCLTSVVGEVILEFEDTGLVSTRRSCGTSGGVCVRRCVFRLLLWLKLRPQTGHLCGDSSMCRILWTAKVRLWQNPLPQSLHLNGFSLLCMYLSVRVMFPSGPVWAFFSNQRSISPPHPLRAWLVVRSNLTLFALRELP